MPLATHDARSVISSIPGLLAVATPDGHFGLVGRPPLEQCLLLFAGDTRHIGW